MAKNKNRKARKSEKPKERVTLEAIAAMSDSDGGEEVPQSQWNTKAKNLAKAIEEGKFDALLEKMKGGDSDGDEIEEASLRSSSESEEEDAGKADQEEKLVPEHGESKSESEEEEEDGDDEEGAVKDNTPVDEEQEDEEEKAESADSEDPKMMRLRANNNQNAKALAVVTAEMVASHSKLPWAERFDVIPETPLPFGENGDEESNPLDVHDDLKREVAFYNLALEAVHKARAECKKATIPFSRPDDFFAEMVKTDDHMAKVKDKLIFENKKMEAVAQRKSNREQKLRAKESHSNKLVEKAKRKRDHFQQVEEWANSAAKNRGGALEDDADEAFLKQRGPNKKREYADKKFGYGGKRGRFKQNDRESMNDTSGFNPRGNFAGGMKRTGKGGAGAGGGANRQGKRARDAGRNRNRS